MVTTAQIQQNDSDDDGEDIIDYNQDDIFNLLKIEMKLRQLRFMKGYKFTTLEKITTVAKI